MLTCTPSPQFANNHNIQWQIDGQDTIGNFLFTSGSFTTVAGVGGGSGTNAITTFLLGKLWIYLQTNTAAPVLSPYPFLLPYEFSAETMLSSNRMATNVTVTIPVTSGVSNLVQNLLEPESFDLNGEGYTNLTTFNTTFPSGNYVFKVSATTSNQQVTVNLPNVTQPNAPQVSNFNAAQAVDPSQPFTLTWNAFAGGSSADWILLEVIGEGNPIFETPFFGQTGALTGTATSVTIPANTLQSSSNYGSRARFLSWHRHVRWHDQSTEAYVGSGTYFTIITTGSGGSRAGSDANAAWSRWNLRLRYSDFTRPDADRCFQHQLEQRASSTLADSADHQQRPALHRPHQRDPHAATNKALFYRARNGKLKDRPHFSLAGLCVYSHHLRTSLSLAWKSLPDESHWWNGAPARN